MNRKINRDDKSKSRFEGTAGRLKRAVPYEERRAKMARRFAIRKLNAMKLAELAKDLKESQGLENSVYNRALLTQEIQKGLLTRIKPENRSPVEKRLLNFLGELTTFEERLAKVTEYGIFFPDAIELYDRAIGICEQMIALKRSQAFEKRWAKKLGSFQGRKRWLETRRDIRPDSKTMVERQELASLAITASEYASVLRNNCREFISIGFAKIDIVVREAFKGAAHD
ncbi:MAG: hypothetical protein WC634_03365 [archaeon]